MELVEQEQATRAMMVPTMLKMLMDHPEFHQHNLTSLQVITYGAAPMPLPVIRQAYSGVPGQLLYQRIRADGDCCDDYDATA